MPATRYYTVNGVIMGEHTIGGSRLNYIPDALGSVIATVDQSNTVQSTARYKPFGDLLASTGTQPAFRWVGTAGYFAATGQPHAEMSVRARFLSSKDGRWTSVDPLWPVQQAFNYAYENPTSFVDPSGLRPCKPDEELGCYAVCGRDGGRFVGTCTATDFFLGLLPSDIDCHCEPLLPDCGCTAERLASLTLQIIQTCNVDRACKQFLSFPPDHTRCPQIVHRISLGLACIYARRAVNDECFDGGTQGHNDQIAEAQNAINTCSRALAFNRCGSYPK